MMRMVIGVLIALWAGSVFADDLDGAKVACDTKVTGPIGPMRSYPDVRFRYSMPECYVIEQAWATAQKARAKAAEEAADPNVRAIRGAARRLQRVR